MVRSRVLIAIFAIWCHCVELSLVQNGKPALIIDRITGAVIDLPPSIPKKSECGSWANACPAQSTADEAFVIKHALNENPVFIKQICTEDETLETAKFGIDICSKYFQISAVFNKMNLTFDFGYEVYVSEENKNLFPNSNVRENYITVGKALYPMDTDSGFKKFTNEMLHFIFGENYTFSHEGRKMSFMWISVFEVEFDFEELTPERIFYQVRSNTRWPLNSSTSCAEDKLTNEVYQKLNKKVYEKLNRKVYEKIDIKYMYSDLLQQMTFVLHVIPDETISEGCRDSWVCLNQWPLIPIDQFHFGGLKNTQCSHMATIPIWTSTLKFPLMKVDKFIYALFQVLESPLHVVAGISGQLRLALKQPLNNYPIRETESDIYIDMFDKKVPVPEIIYKIVKYKSEDCSEGDSCWYSATIVIHNDPFFKPGNEICPDMTAEWGWTEVNLYVADLPISTEKRHQSKYIYVCKSDPKLLTRLMGSSAEKQPQKMNDFNLTESFPKGTKNRIDNETIEREVFKKLLVLTEIQREFLDIQSERILAETELKLMRIEEHRQ